MMVPGECRSLGCHGYLRGLLVAPRHLPHTYLLLMGLNWICMREPTCTGGHHLVDVWQAHCPSLFSLHSPTRSLRDSEDCEAGYYGKPFVAIQNSVKSKIYTIQLF